MKRLLWIMAALGILLGACSNATDSARAAEDPSIIVGQGLDLNNLSSLDDIFFSKRENINVKLGLVGARSLSIDPSGSLPSGLSMDSTGLITGTADVVDADATANFTVVSDTGVEKAITWIVKAPRTHTITANGDWTAPNDPGGYSTNSTVSLQVLIAGGGGGSGICFGTSRGGGGGGGQVIEEAVQAVPGETISVTIGGGGNGGYRVYDYITTQGGPGGTTSFGSYLSAVGGGGGGSVGGNGELPEGGNPGGSGGGSDGTGASGDSIHGKTSTNKYNGQLITLGGGGAGIAYGVIHASGGSGGGGGIVNSRGSAGTPNTGGGGAGTSVVIDGNPGGSGVVYVNY